MVKPGHLSLQIVNGKKNSYLPPIRLFVLMVVLTLLLSSFLNRLNRSWDDVDHLRKDAPDSIVEAAVDTAALDSLDNEIVIENGEMKFDNSETGRKLNRIFQFTRNNKDTSIVDGLKALELEDTFFNHLIHASFLKINLMNGDEYKSFIMSNLLIILLLFIPILAFLLKALYFYKRQYFFVDHFVFAVNQQTALFVLISLYFILDGLFAADWLLFVIFLVIFPIHLFLALKNFYQQNTIITVVNFTLINTAFVLVGIIFIILVLIVSFILV